jgi:hypothetical protein
VDDVRLKIIVVRRNSIVPLRQPCIGIVRLQGACTLVSPVYFPCRYPGFIIFKLIERLLAKERNERVIFDSA